MPHRISNNSDNVKSLREKFPSTGLVIWVADRHFGSKVALRSLLGQVECGIRPFNYFEPLDRGPTKFIDQTRQETAMDLKDRSTLSNFRYIVIANAYRLGFSDPDQGAGAEMNWSRWANESGKLVIVIAEITEHKTKKSKSVDRIPWLYSHAYAQITYHAYHQTLAIDQQNSLTSRSYSTKLLESQIIIVGRQESVNDAAVKREWESGERNGSAIARSIGISPQAVNRILKRLDLR